MKSIRNKIVYMSFEGAITARNVTFLMQELQNLKDNSTKTAGTKNILVSIKDLRYDIEALKNLVKRLNLFSLKADMDVAIGEYDANTFTLLSEYTKKTCVKLFHDFVTAKIFFEPTSFAQPLKVLLFDEDEDNIEALSSILSKHNHTTVYAQNLEDFKKKAKGSDITNAISLTKYNLSRKAVKNSIPVVSLSKNIVTHLPVFVDTAVDHITMITSLNAKKVAHEVKPFSTDLTGQSISAIMSFDGDFKGKFVLIFPKDLAFKTVEAMLGEKISSLNEVSDGIGEFCNIITGGTKTVLSKKNVKVLFDLPKTNTNLISTKASLTEGSGIWITMKLEEQPFYMYISA